MKRVVITSTMDIAADQKTLSDFSYICVLIITYYTSYYSGIYMPPRRLNNAIIRISHDSIHRIVHYIISCACDPTSALIYKIIIGSLYLYTSCTRRDEFTAQGMCFRGIFVVLPSTPRRRLHNYKRPTRTHSLK